MGRNSELKLTYYLINTKYSPEHRNLEMKSYISLNATRISALLLSPENIIV